MFLVLQWYFIPRSRHCGLIATQSEIPLLWEHVLLVWWFFATPVFFDVFVFLQVPVFLVSQWCICSKSLVGQRWCLTSCSAIFVWLQFYMRSYACWIATLWHETYAVWDSSAFREFFISFFLDRCRLLFVWLVCPLTGPRVLGITVVLYSEIATLWLHSHSVWDSSGFRARFSSLMVLCHSRFVWRVCVPTGSRVLGITVVYLFEILGWSSLMFEMMFGNFRLTAVLEAVICLLDRNTVAWYPFSLIFVPFWADLIISLKLCRFFFIWQIVFFPVPVFFVSNWYISSRSLVGQRWCLRWCLVIFVWLQC